MVTASPHVVEILGRLLLHHLEAIRQHLEAQYLAQYRLRTRMLGRADMVGTDRRAKRKGHGNRGGGPNAFPVAAVSTFLRSGPTPAPVRSFDWRSAWARLLAQT